MKLIIRRQRILIDELVATLFVGANESHWDVYQAWLLTYGDDDCYYDFA